jgi:hypothetical protein
MVITKNVRFCSALGNNRWQLQNEAAGWVRSELSRQSTKGASSITPLSDKCREQAMSLIEGS